MDQSQDNLYDELEDAAVVAPAADDEEVDYSSDYNENHDSVEKTDPNENSNEEAEVNAANNNDSNAIKSEQVESNSNDNSNQVLQEAIDDDTARFFVLRPDNFEEIAEAYTKSIVYPPFQVAERILTVSKNSKIYLIFCVNNSSHIQGFAIFDGKNSSKSTRKLSIIWQRLSALSLSSINHIVNKYNGNQPLKTSRDGQETLDNVKASLQEIQAANGAYSNHHDSEDHSDRRNAHYHDKDRKRIRNDGPSGASTRTGKHPAAFDLDLCDMTYDEYLEQYRIRQSLARDQFHASLAASAAASGAPMGMMAPPMMMMHPGPASYYGPPGVPNMMMPGGMVPVPGMHHPNMLMQHHNGAPGQGIGRPGPNFMAPYGGPGPRLM